MITLRFLDTLPTAVVDELQSLVSQIRGFLSVAHNEDGTIIGSNPMLNVVPIGLPAPWLTAIAPTGWVLLDGAQKNRVTYKALFELWGTTFGVGDGSTTFNLPDFRGRFFLGKAPAGTGSVIGETGGALDHDHTISAHTHSIPAHTHTISSDGAHTHTFTTGSSGAHTHTYSGTTGQRNEADNSTDVAVGLTVNVSDHTHNYSGTTSSDGAHTHTGTTDSGGAHSHGGVTGSTSGTTGSSSGTSGTANPAYITGNWIAFAGV